MIDDMEKLKKLPFFTVEEAEKHGLSRRMLSYYVKKGELIRISRGVYCFANYESSSEDFKWEDLGVAASNIKGGVICLVSALAYYGLTDEVMREFWIAVDVDNSKAKFPMCRIVRMRNMKLGVEEIKISGMDVRIFDIERTVVDSFRHLSFETAMTALKRYLVGDIKRPDLDKLDKYIKELRASKVKNYIMAVKG